MFVNLCEGYLEWEVPSIDVIHSLEALNLPYTVPNPTLYDPPKPLMKYVAYCSGVKSLAAVEVQALEDIDEILEKLAFPLFVKPAKAGDSLGIDELSLVHNEKELRAKVSAVLPEFGDLLVEEYIDGRELTVLVAANPDGKTCTVYKPVEYIFPEGRSFKTYSLKTSELHPDANVPCKDRKLEKQLKAAAEQIFTSFGGVGYGRLDFRVDKNNQIYFLEINFTCSTFYEDGYEGSADYILKYDPAGKVGFLNQIISEGIARHAAKQKKYVLKGNAVSGYGIFASRDIAKNEVIFRGETMAQRIVTKRWVETHWNERQKLDFRQYAYPVGKDVFILWDENPTNWAPQNHSCDANTGYQGLNVVATRAISKGDELTLDYATFLDENMEPFLCQCGSPKCREYISGAKRVKEKVAVERFIEPVNPKPLRKVKP